MASAIFLPAKVREVPLRLLSTNLRSSSFSKAVNALLIAVGVIEFSYLLDIRNLIQLNEII